MTCPLFTVLLCKAARSLIVISSPQQSLAVITRQLTIAPSFYIRVGRDHTWPTNKGCAVCLEVACADTTVANLVLSCALCFLR